MVLRVPDYFKEFSCIADECKDSCCIGWEIDIDEDTYDYYNCTEGEIGDRIKKYMYMTEDKEHSFQLEANGRCPFLNRRNLCDICIELGEEALSEVCTEYPRFAIEYGNVLQKCLSLSCEEVGRILFSRENPVEIVDYELQDESYDMYETQEVLSEYISEDENEGDIAEEDDPARILAMEQMQREAIAYLQDRTRPIEERMCSYLCFLLEEDKTQIQLDEEADKEKLYEDFLERFAVFAEMETLDAEWELVKEQFAKGYTKDSYKSILSSFMESTDYRENDYEQLLVYFTFRYMMNAVYDYDVASYAKLAIVFTLVIRDMDALRFYLNGGHFDLSDRIDTARIFSKEVEHSQDNIELAKEAFLFDDIFKLEKLIQQI